MRYLVKFTKESEIKFIAHLDLMRTIQRIIRRAGLPIEYSKGFNPHMTISIAQPLSVGIYSKGEYMDIVLVEDLQEEDILKKLNDNRVNGIKFLKVIKVEKEENKKSPQSMAAIDGAEYKIGLRVKDSNAIHMDDLLKLTQWNTIKKTKSGEKEVDIKPLVKEFKYTLKDDVLIIDTMIACGSRENLSPSLLSDYIKEKIQGIDTERFVDISRIEMYALKNNKLVPLYEFFK